MFENLVPWAIENKMWLFALAPIVIVLVLMKILR